MSDPSVEKEQGEIWTGLKIWGIVLFVFVIAAATYSIVKPNKSPLTPQEKQLQQDTTHQTDQPSQ